MKKTQRMFWNDYYRKHGNVWRKVNYFEEDFSGKKVLELGCGNGKSVAGIFEKNPLKLCAVDFSEIAIRVAEERFPEGVDFFRAECQELPFKNNEFDFVVCRHVLGAMDAKDAAQSVGEIKRVLKKGGEVLFSDFGIGDLREKGSMVGVNTYQKKNGILQHFFTENEAKKLFGGFSGVTVETKSNYLMLSGKRVLRTEVFATAIK